MLVEAEDSNTLRGVVALQYNDSRSSTNRLTLIPVRSRE